MCRQCADIRNIGYTILQPDIGARSPIKCGQKQFHDARHYHQPKKEQRRNGALDDNDAAMISVRVRSEAGEWSDESNLITREIVAKKPRAPTNFRDVGGS